MIAADELWLASQLPHSSTNAQNAVSSVKPVFHQARLSALFHQPMILSFNHLMYFMLSEVIRTQYVFCIEN